jgi:hypothetical protein
MMSPTKVPDSGNLAAPGWSRKFLFSDSDYYNDFMNLKTNLKLLSSLFLMKSM